MRNRRWYIRFWQNWIVKFVPEWIQKKGGQRMMWLLILACIHWQVVDRMDGQQVHFAIAYAKAQIALFIGLDPEGAISISLSNGDHEVSRVSVAKMMDLDVEWGLFSDAAARGLKLALLFIFALLAWSFGNAIIEKQYRIREKARVEIDRKAALIKEQETYQWKKPKPMPPAPILPVETQFQNIFESPEVELLAELIDETDGDNPSPVPPPAEPPVGKPLRLPGRIYRGDE